MGWLKCSLACNEGIPSNEEYMKTIMSNGNMESLRGKHKGETAWIIGKGPSLQYLTADDIGDGPVVTINQSILDVENLGLKNKIYSMQKDGGNKRVKSSDNLNPNCPERHNGCGDSCGGMNRPKHATLLVHDLESKYCFSDYSPRHVISWSDFGLNGNSFSLAMAVETVRAMGCTAIRFLCFDSFMVGDHRTYVPGKGVCNAKNRFGYSDQVIRIKAFIDGIDCKWLMPNPQGGCSVFQSQSQKIAFGVMINDILRLDMVLRQSQIDGDMHYVKNPESATRGLNLLLDIIENEGNDIAVLTHQDMYYTQGWTDKVKDQLSLLPDSWIVAGIIGKDYEGRICGKFHDMRVPLHFNTSEYHTFPHPACCFDECCIIVNMKSGFRFDETVDGFDLYGTLCVLQAWEMGGTAWVIDAFAEHYCMRPFTWVPDQLFRDNYRSLHDRFEKINNGKRLDSTAIGLPKEIIDEINEKMAFMTSAA